MTIAIEVYNTKNSKTLGEFLGSIVLGTSMLMNYKGMKDVMLPLQQLPGVAKASKYVKGSIVMSFDSSFVKGGPVI
jgi:hypothetical protein